MKLFNFIFKKNELTRTNLEKQLSSAANDILMSLFYNVNSFLKKNENLDDVPISEYIKRPFIPYVLFREMSFLSLHLVDRYSFQLLSLDKRAALMDLFFLIYVERFEKKYLKLFNIIIKDNFKDNFLTEYNIRSILYGKIKELYPSEGKPFKDTLFWEASNLISKLYFKDDNGVALLLPTLTITADGGTNKFFKILKNLPKS